MASEKEKCFEKALKKFNQEAVRSLFNFPLDVTLEEGWVQDLDGTWRSVGRNYDWRELNREMELTRRIQDDLAPPRPPGSANPLQFRRLDIVLRWAKRLVVLDNKFTRKNGRLDDWQKPLGKGNGKTQQHDYDHIMKDANKDPNAPGAGKLNKDTCKCDGKGAPIEVRVPSPYGDVPNNQLEYLIWSGLNGVEDALYEAGVQHIPPFRWPELPIPIGPGRTKPFGR